MDSANCTATAAAATSIVRTAAAATSIVCTAAAATSIVCTAAAATSIVCTAIPTIPLPHSIPALSLCTTTICVRTISTAALCRASSGTLCRASSGTICRASSGPLCHASSAPLYRASSGTASVTIIITSATRVANASRQQSALTKPVARTRRAAAQTSFPRGGGGGRQWRYQSSGRTTAATLGPTALR